MKKDVYSATTRWARWRRRAAVLGWILLCALLTSGCMFAGKSAPEVKGYALPDSLLTCRAPYRFVLPELADTAAVGAALVDVYDAWEDCHAALGRVKQAVRQGAGR